MNKEVYNKTEKSKKCNRCKEIKPLTPEYFHRDRSKEDGFHTLCKKCRHKYEKTKERITYMKEWNKLYKKNSRKTYNKSKKGKEKNKKWEEENREKQNILHRKYRKKQNEKTLKTSGLRYNTLHNYIRSIKTNPKFCTICNEPKTLEIASINHTYTMNINDWIYLCKECHILLDEITNGDKDN